MAKPSSAKTRRRTSKVRRTKSKSRRGGGKGPNASFMDAYIKPYLPRGVSNLSSSSMAYTPSYGGPAGAHRAAMNKLENELIKMEGRLEDAGELTKDEIKARVDAHKADRLKFIDKWTPNPHRSIFSRVSSGISKFKFKTPSELVYIPAEFKNDDHIWTEITKGMSPDSISNLNRIRYDNDVKNITKTPSGVRVRYKKTHPIHGSSMNMFIPS